MQVLVKIEQKMINKNYMSLFGWFSLGILITILVLIIGPILIIYSINMLFHYNLDYNIESIFAIFLILTVVRTWAKL